MSNLPVKPRTYWALVTTKKKLAEAEKERKRLLETLLRVCDAMDSVYDYEGLYSTIGTILHDAGIRHKDETDENAKE